MASIIAIAFGILATTYCFFYFLLREYGLPIYTLRLPFQRIYVVNGTSLIPVLQKHWRTISFAALTASAGAVCGMSPHSARVMNHDLKNEEGFSISWPRYIAPSLAPGSKDLDAINKKSVEVFSAELARQRAKGPKTTGLVEWSKQLMIRSTTEAIYGPSNPYKENAIAEAWKLFESGFLNFSIFPAAMAFSPKFRRARDLVTGAMVDYMQQGGHEQASGLVRKRFEHHRSWGLSIDDVGRGEVGNTFAILGNSTPCAFWLLYHIFSDKKVLSDIRRELLGLVRDDQNDDENVCSIDLADIRSSCPLRSSTFQEVLRYRSLGVGPRFVLEDVFLEGQTLCPGRHFASTEIMMLAAVSVLQFDILPVGGRWVEPTSERSPSGASFPIPDEDINVQLRPRDLTKEWHISFSGPGEAIKIAMEDLA
ncbi:cytochrome P450 [Apiospora saccharicola]